MAVKRAWVSKTGIVKLELTNQEVPRFYEKIIAGLLGLAQLRVIEESKSENRVVKAAVRVVNNV